jgi:hypothetical protein
VYIVCQPAVMQHCRTVLVVSSSNKSISSMVCCERDGGSHESWNEISLLCSAYLKAVSASGMQEDR